MIYLPVILLIAYRLLRLPDFVGDGLAMTMSHSFIKLIPLLGYDRQLW